MDHNDRLHGKLQHDFSLFPLRVLKPKIQVFIPVFGVFIPLHYFFCDPHGSLHTIDAPPHLSVILKSNILATIVHLQDQLLDRCKEGDNKAQSDLYHRYAKAMFNVAMRITRDYMEAEDVLQESFVRAFRNLTSFKGDSTFGAWLKRIVINTAINHIKRRKFLYDHLDEKHSEEASFEEPQATSYPPHLSQVQWAIKKLPEGYRLVFTLYLIEGYDHQEISQILNISEATSKSQYCRAKKKIRELLSEKIAV